MKIAGTNIDAESRSFVKLEVCTLTNGSTLYLPVHVIAGKNPKPTLLLIGSIHGDESLTVEIFANLLARTRPSKMSGTLMIVPVANPLALEFTTRNTPIDMLDLNRNFPGSMNGWLTEKIASKISEELILKSDYFVDFHTAPPYLEVDYCIGNIESKLGKEISRMVRAFGQRYVYATDGYRGAATTFAEASGIPSFASETGDGNKYSNNYVSGITKRVENLMKELEMLEGKPSFQEQYYFTKDSYGNIRPLHGGVLKPNTNAKVGSTLHETELLGEIISPYSFETLEKIRSFYKHSVVLLARRRSVVRPGDYCFMVANSEGLRPLK